MGEEKSTPTILSRGGGKYKSKHSIMPPYLVMPAMQTFYTPKKSLNMGRNLQEVFHEERLLATPPHPKKNCLKNSADKSLPSLSQLLQDAMHQQ